MLTHPHPIHQQVLDPASSGFKPNLTTTLLPKPPSAPAGVTPAGSQPTLWLLPLLSYNLDYIQQ